MLKAIPEGAVESQASRSNAHFLSTKLMNIPHLNGTVRKRISQVDPYYSIFSTDEQTPH